MTNIKFMPFDKFQDVFEQILANLIWWFDRIKEIDINNYNLNSEDLFWSTKILMINPIKMFGQ